MGRLLIGTSLVALSGALTLGCGGPPGSTATALVPPEQAPPPQAAGPPAIEGGITVVGEGSVQAASDQATVVLGVEVGAESVSAAFTQANTAAEDVIEALEAAGVPSEDIRTAEVSVRERREAPPGPAEEGQPEITGYVVSNLVEVTIDDLERASAVIDAAVEAGGDAARVRSFRLGVDRDEVALDEARAAAFEDARQRAELYAELAGRGLGPLVSLSEIVGGGGPGPVALSEAAVEGAAPPIEPGQQELSVRIQATWSLG